jgi:hypothetical protein
LMSFVYTTLKIILGSILLVIETKNLYVYESI